ncbi:MAG TPA: ABC transporter permease, partial [Vicinamibacterales bacterium]|nr:ABC transporter permease [Vicinamibacterales bacterium]
AIGIGANTAIFSVMNALVLRQLPIDRPSETYFLERTGLGERNLRFSYPMLGELQAAVPEVQIAAMTGMARFQLTMDEGAEFAFGQLVSGNWFDVAGVRAGAGRVLHASDNETLDAHPVVVLSDAFWTRRFGRSPAVVGRTLLVNGTPMTVVGVAAPGFFGLTVGQSVDLWMPIVMQHALHHAGNASTEGESDTSKPWPPQREIRWLTFFMRVPDPTPLPPALARLDATYRRPIEERAAKRADAQERAYMLREHVGVLPAARGLSDLRETYTRPLAVLMTTVAIVLLIACANLASLLLARSAAREREFSLRLSIGARRGRLIRQLLTESVLLSTLGGAVGLVVATWGSRALLRLASSSATGIPLDVSLDWTLVAFTLGVSLITGLAFGLAPALRLSRSDLGGVLRGAGRVVGAGGGRWSIGRLLIVGQVALSLVLLVGALLFLGTVRNLLSTPTGFDQQVLSARFDPRASGKREAELAGLYLRLLEEVRRIPGARSVSLALSGPVTGAMNISSIDVEGRAESVGDDDSARFEYVGPDYLRTVGIPLARGRDFGPTDTATAPKAALVNETFVRYFFGDANPIGKRFGFDSDADFTIVGVVRDALVDGVRSAPPRQAYLLLAQHPEVFVRNVYVRTDGPAATLKPLLARAIAAADGDLAIREVVTLAELAERYVTSERLVSSLTSAFAMLAIGVACLGLFGTVAYSVARRTNELGVRIALGATPAGVRWMVLREILILVAAGCLAGTIVALFALRGIASLLYGLAPHDPVSIAAAIAALLAMGLISGLVPAWRASRVDPLTALRT